MNKVFFAVGVSMLAPLALAKPVIATSIKPVSMIVTAIAGDKANIEQIVSSSASPHDFALRPSDLRKIHNADTVVWVGEALESFLEKPLHNAGKDSTAIEWLALNGMKLNNFGDSDKHDDHGHKKHDDHGHKKHDDHGHKKHDDHKSHDDHEGHDHSGVDPHVWLSPDNALVLARAVAERLVSIDSANAAYYQGNLAAFEQGLSVKDAEIREAMSKVNTVPYIVFHDAYRYFEQHYGLQNVGQITVSPERSPGARKVAELRHKIEGNKVHCVFSEPQFSPAIVRALLEGVDVKTASLDPLGSDIKMGSNAYFSFLDSLSGQFLSCLG